MTQEQKPNRRWLSFSLRTLLVIVTIACVGFGWLGAKVRAKQREREVVKAIRKSGCFAHYDYESESNLMRVKPDAVPPGPKWLRNMVGDNFFCDVVSVSLFGPLPDSEMSRVREFRRLEYLRLARTRVTDAGLVHLAGLNQLKELNLSETRVTDAGLLHLQGLTTLNILWLIDTQVSDAGARELQKALPHLSIIR